MQIRWILLASLAIAAASAVHEPQCEDLSCASKEDLLSTIKHLQKERMALNLHKTGTHINSIMLTATDATATTTVSNPLASTQAPQNPQQCSICNSSPCLNGGTCAADSTDPFHKFICVCPDQFGGPTCAQNITCTANSCGPNADCYVSNHQTNCICKHGYTGNDPRNQGCQQKIVSACCSGDPHCKTFDGLRYDYQGTCPYTFSQPCSNLTGGFDNFKVVAKNELAGISVSYVTEVEVTMFGYKFHIDRVHGNTFVNGLKTDLPYYYPSQSNPKVKVYYSSGMYYIINLVDSVKVTFTTSAELCIYIPDVPEMRGNQTLCGFAGNYDGLYKNDIVGTDGTVWPVSNNPEPTSTGEQHVLDSWITWDFLLLQPNEEQCSPGEQLANNTQCNTTAAVQQCFPILQAAVGTGPLGKCSPMGNQTIQDYYNNCVYDVCHGYKICDSLTDFARSCMNQLPNTDLGNWRDSVTPTCDLICQTNSHYSSCKSSCPATCAEQYKPDFCDQPCSEGCTCDDGYVIDNTNTLQVTCIRVEDCGCNDAYGNPHPPNQPWLSNNCNVLNQCLNGTFNSQIYGCSPYADCVNDGSGQLGCKCKPGFTGNGTYCEDINECLDPNTCSQNQGYGNCTNTIGSYQCTCKTFYDGHDCQCYHPKRHCADLYKYWQMTTTGVYTINPPYPYGGRPAFTDHQVYCDMETSGGGWTLMSHDYGSGMAKKTFNDYAIGFGNASEQNMWLGLDIINGMTQDVETSLMLLLERCAHGGLPKKTTNCVYPTFRVDAAFSNYTVTIPEVCSGTEEEYYDGWARWNLTLPGPQFLTYDHDNTNGDCACSATFRNTGWWFDTHYRCGSANLNGVRYSCDSPPDNSLEGTYLYWSGSPMGDAWLTLRPRAYPDYDNHPITCHGTKQRLLQQ